MVDFGRVQCEACHVLWALTHKLSLIAGMKAASGAAVANDSCGQVSMSRSRF